MTTITRVSRAAAPMKWEEDVDQPLTEAQIKALFRAHIAKEMAMGQSTLETIKKHNEYTYKEQEKYQRIMQIGHFAEIAQIMGTGVAIPLVTLPIHPLLAVACFAGGCLLYFKGSPSYTWIHKKLHFERHFHNSQSYPPLSRTQVQWILALQIPPDMRFHDIDPLGIKSSQFSYSISESYQRLQNPHVLKIAEQRLTNVFERTQSMQEGYDHFNSLGFHEEINALDIDRLDAFADALTTLKMPTVQIDLCMEYMDGKPLTRDETIDARLWVEGNLPKELTQMCRDYEGA